MHDHQNTPLTLMAIHAHPDDEVFSGGIFPLMADRGVRTVLVTATGGEEGEIVDPELDEAAKQAMFPRLGEVRRQELKASVEALRITESRLLGYRDSGMAGTESNNHPDSFHRANLDEAVKRVVALIRELKPQILLTYDAFGSYGHPDHLQAQRVTNVAFEAAGEPRLYPDLGLAPWQPSKLYYLASPRNVMVKAMNTARAAGIPGPWDNPAMNIENFGTPDELITARIDVHSYMENKMQAIRAHKTQIAPDNFVFMLPAEYRENFLGYEHFVLARRAPAQRTGALEEHLFADIL